MSIIGVSTISPQEFGRSSPFGFGAGLIGLKGPIGLIETASIVVALHIFESAPQNCPKHVRVYSIKFP